MSPVYLFSVTPDTPPVETIESGGEVSLVVRGAFADCRGHQYRPDALSPPPATGHPLAPVSGPIRVNGAAPGDAVPGRPPRDGRPRRR